MKELVQQIIEAEGDQDALSILHDISQKFGIDDNHKRMIDTRDALRAQGNNVRDLVAEYNSIEVPRPQHKVQEIRIEANFLYTMLVDEFGHEVNRQKIALEEAKTIERAKGLEWLSNQPDYADVSKSALRDYLGAAPSYQKWSRKYAIAYGNYSKLRDLLTALKGLTDSCASEIRGQQVVEQKDAH